MTLDGLIARFWAWIDQVAGLILDLVARLKHVTPATLVETAEGTFALAGATPADTPSAPFRLDGEDTLPAAIATGVKGRAVTVQLRPERFLFRPLELPARAGDFLDGIVRAQIDRLTPWMAEAAAFGWTAPTDAGDGRIMVTVAATARDRVADLATPLAAAGAQSVTLATRSGEAETPITVLTRDGAGRQEARRLRQGLAGLLAGALVSAVGAQLAAEFAGAELTDRQAEIEHRIAVQRRLLTAGRDGEAGAALQALERRKQESPSTVLVLDWLAQALPDDTHLTELHVNGEQVQIMGLAQDAPALIQRLEQSRRFTTATFIAPTTRASGEAGERFHIETHARPAGEAAP